MNRKGWVRIIEAFMALLLIIGVTLLVLNEDSASEDSGSEVYDVEIAILRGVQLDNSLRTNVLNLNNLPVEYDSVEFPSTVKNEINDGIPRYVECTARVCELDSICTANVSTEDVYAQTVVISANEEIYSSRQLKLFCWFK